MKKITEENIAEKWLSSFARGISEEFIKNHVHTDCNFLWHIFSFGEAQCLKEGEAKKAFDALSYEKAYIFKSGYCQNGKPEILDFGITDKIDYNKLPKHGDVYITALDFSWTYVRTHEDGCFGPYFARKKLYDWEIRNLACENKNLSTDIE